MFGNPGTTEMPLIDSLTDYPQLAYYLALHEGVAVGMADAFALATGKPGVANVHVAPGLGNALGMLFNAWEGRSPLLLTAGQQDTRMRLRDPLLAHDLVGMAAPLVKWSAQAERASELPLLVHRALKTALEPPAGPVFLSLPINVMEEAVDGTALAPAPWPSRPQPDPAEVKAAVALLLEARQPAIVCGDGVFRAGAQGELVALAELLGAPVWHTVLPAALSFPMTHPHYRGELPGDHARIRQALGRADAVLLVGGEFFKEIFHAAESPLAESAAVIQIDAAPQALARNLSPAVAMAADPRAALHALHEAMLSAASANYHAAAERRRETQAELKQAERLKQEQRLKRGWAQRPIASARVMWELKQALPKPAVVVSEAITASADLMRTLSLERPGDYYGSRGGGIGQGLPTALGVQVAHPDRRVVCVSGDGSAMYSIQALWTAAHHHLPVVFVILNNRAYRVLKINMDRYRSDFGLAGERPYPHMDLIDPELEFVRLSEGMGVPARRVEQPEELGAAFRDAFASGTPYLLDVVVEGRWPV
jgi:benzoylformate decarboxylase